MTSYVLSHVVEHAYEHAYAQGWGRYVPYSWRRRAAPYCMLYLKHKSNKALGLVELRPILSHTEHPLSRLAGQMSRALTIPVQHLASMPGNSESFAMPDVLHHFTMIHQHMCAQHGNTSAWELGELYLEDMFLKIEKAALLDCYDYMIRQLDTFEPPPAHCYPSRCKKAEFVSLLKVTKQFDCLHKAPGLDLFDYVTVESLRSFVDFELRFNNLFYAGGYVLSQHKGVPMRGQLSSQSSSLLLMTKEMHNTHLSLYGNRVLHIGCNDNSYVYGPPGFVFPHIHQWCAALRTICLACTSAWVCFVCA